MWTPRAGVRCCHSRRAAEGLHLLPIPVSLLPSVLPNWLTFHRQAFPLLPPPPPPPPPLSRSEDEEDIVDETLYLYRANSLFRNFEIKGPADRTLIYLTFYTQQCLKELEKETEPQKAERALLNLAAQNFAAPGDAGWQLGTIFPSSKSREELGTSAVLYHPYHLPRTHLPFSYSDLFKSYMKQCREELSRRLITRVFDASGTKSKWWQLFSRRKFMGKELR
jgi:actin related protein 2/3 complex subunit 3